MSSTDELELELEHERDAYRAYQCGRKLVTAHHEDLSFKLGHDVELGPKLSSAMEVSGSPRMELEGRERGA